MKQVVSIGVHSWRLSKIIYEIAVEYPAVRSPRSRLILDDAGEWLDIAASVEGVQLRTARYDDSIMWCRGAAEYEDRRSEALGECIRFLTMFSFAWSAIEVLSQVVRWPNVPKQLQGGDAKPSVIERMVYALHSTVPIDGYDLALDHLRKELGIRPLFVPRKAKTFVGPAGEALDIIRHFRNTFAHGALQMPDGQSSQPWQSGKTSEGHVALIATRLALFSVQMLLTEQFGDDELFVGSDDPGPVRVRDLVANLHFAGFAFPL